MRETRSAQYGEAQKKNWKKFSKPSGLLGPLEIYKRDREIRFNGRQNGNTRWDARTSCPSITIFPRATAGVQLPIESGQMGPIGALCGIRRAAVGQAQPALSCAVAIASSGIGTELPYPPSWRRQRVTASPTSIPVDLLPILLPKQKRGPRGPR